MEDLVSKTLEELEKICSALGFPRFKGREIFRFIHNQLKENLSDLTTLSLSERQRLQEKYYISKIIPRSVLKGRKVQKSAFQLEDGCVIETVMLEYENARNTLCVSSQVGCPVGCKFCATGRMGFARNLSLGEILSQVYYLARLNKISNLVFMGMGEPFLNYENVMAAAKILNHPLGLKIAARKITISTIGIPAGIKKFAQEKAQFRLAWSLVSPFDPIRKKLIPWKGLVSPGVLLKTLSDYQEKTSRRVTIEYVVLKNINDRPEDLKGLIRISKQLNCHINIISYNSILEAPFENGNIKRLFLELEQAGVKVTVRKSLGADIRAACGQLASVGKF